MTPTEKAIRDFCGHHADWWPSTTQVQEMLALAQPCPTCEALARTVMLDQTSHDAQRKPLTENEIKTLWYDACQTNLELTSQLIVHLARNIEAAHGIKE
jgi:bacterioferritin-associated ferredoxin